MTFGRAPGFIIDPLFFHCWLRDETEVNQFIELRRKPCSFIKCAVARDGADSAIGHHTNKLIQRCWANMAVSERAG